MQTASTESLLQISETSRIFFSIELTHSESSLNHNVTDSEISTWGTDLSPPGHQGIHTSSGTFQRDPLVPTAFKSIFHHFGISFISYTFESNVTKKNLRVAAPSCWSRSSAANSRARKSSNKLQLVGLAGRLQQNPGAASAFNVYFGSNQQVLTGPAEHRLVSVKELRSVNWVQTERSATIISKITKNMFHLGSRESPLNRL